MLNVYAQSTKFLSKFENNMIWINNTRIVERLGRCRVVKLQSCKVTWKSIEFRKEYMQFFLSKWGGGESNRMVMSISCQRRFGQRKLFVHMSLVCLPSSDTEGCKKHECDILEQDKGACVGDTIKIIGIQGGRSWQP